MCLTQHRILMVEYHVTTYGFVSLNLLQFDDIPHRVSLCLAFFQSGLQIALFPLHEC